MVDAAFFNTLHYKVQIKRTGAILGKEQRPSLHLGVVAIEKESFGSPST